MTALAANYQFASKQNGVKSYPVADNVHIYKGSIVCVNSSGYAVPGANTAAYVTVGIADEEVDNTLTGHAAGLKRVRVISGRHFLMNDVTADLTQAKVGLVVYVTDSGNVSLSESNSIAVGIVTEYVSSTQAWVYIPEPTPFSLATISGLTATATELNQLHSVTAGTAAASKAVVLDASKGVTGLGAIGALHVVQAASADGAIAVAPKHVFITKAGVCAMTLVDPTATTHDGLEIVFIAATANAHTLDNSAGSGFFSSGGASKDVATFGGAIGDRISVVAYQGKWYIKDSLNITLG